MARLNEGSPVAEPRAAGELLPDVVALPKVLWRVHKTSYGPLNPPPRSGPPNKAWSRFDLRGWATLYGAANRVGAYMEALAYAEFVPLPLADLFDDKDPEPVDQQWERLGHMPTRSVPRQWRDVRTMSSFQRVNTGHAVDIASSNSLAYLRETAEQWAPRGLRDKPLSIDVSTLTGQRRTATTRAAWWLSRTVLADGSLPVGIAYPSRHGADLQCYALWVDLDRHGPEVAIAEAVATEYKVLSQEAIELTDTALRTAQKRLGLHLY